MTRQPEPTGEQLEAVYQSMIGAPERRDMGRLDSPLTDEVEFRSLAFSTADEAWAEFAPWQADGSGRS